MYYECVGPPGSENQKNHNIKWFLVVFWFSEVGQRCWFSGFSVLLRKDLLNQNKTTAIVLELLVLLAPGRPKDS